jgi:cysteinyl-tRNA synthetase
MTKFIEELIAKGHAYAVNGNVFYDVTSFPDYGKLSGNTLEKLKVGARLEEHPDKRNPWDFALWLKAPAGHLMRWPSPWGEGYPGWHIECSVMSEEYLGKRFDIHTGGEDHIFPHHEAEIAQSCGVTGAVPARYWMHERHMMIDGEKMSKSKGNFYTLEDIVEKGFSPMDLRMAFLLAHYRSQMNFTWDALTQARTIRQYLDKTRSRVKEALASASPLPAPAVKAYCDRCLASLEDDLNTPDALATIQEFAKKTNTELDAGKPVGRETLFFFEEAYSILGLTFDEAAPIPGEVKRLADERVAARAAKDFARSDALRDEIAALGFAVEDTPSGQKLVKK